MDFRFERKGIIDASSFEDFTDAAEYNDQKQVKNWSEYHTVKVLLDGDELIDLAPLLAKVADDALIFMGWIVDSGEPGASVLGELKPNTKDGQIGSVNIVG